MKVSDKLKVIVPGTKEGPPVSPPGKTAVKMERGTVLVSSVLSLPHHNDLDPDVVSAIAESYALSGGAPLQPIAVRREINIDEDKETTSVLLVAGAHRLEAARYVGLELIDCVYIEGDDADAKLIELGENLWRKTLTVLQRAEMLTEWVSIASNKLTFSGQVVPKGKIGRPRSGLAQAARELPAIGRSAEARRQVFRRARKIAAIVLPAKKAAKATGLDDNQTALLQIANVAPLLQAKKAQELGSLQQAVFGTQKSKKTSDTISQTIQSDETGAIQGDVPEATGAPKARDEIQTTIEALTKEWDRRGRALWKLAPETVRDQFIAMLKRARRYASTDVISFLTEVFRGRKFIECKDLYAFGKTKGFARQTVRKALTDLGYKCKRIPGFGPKKYRYLNKDSGWEEQALVVPDSLLKMAASEPQSSSAQKETPLFDAAYYET